MNHHDRGQDQLPLGLDESSQRIKLGERASCWECGAVDISVNLDWTLRKHKSLAWGNPDNPHRGTACHGPSPDDSFSDVLRSHQMLAPTRRDVQ